MPKFGTRSRGNLNQCHPDLVSVAEVAIMDYDFSVIEGHRPKSEQDEAFKTGASKLKFPYSKHNTLPSFAMDIVPYPVDWENLHRFQELAVVVKKAADRLGVDIHWGYDLWGWDMPHWQLGDK